MTAEELRARLAALRAGDKAAFEEIYESLKTPIFTVILRIVRDRPAAEEVLQEVFFKLWQQPPGPEIGNPRAYIFRAAHNLALDHLRMRPQSVGLDGTDAYAQTEDISLKMDIERALAALPPQECRIVSLHVSGGLKFREIAGMTGLPLGTVLWKYQRAIKRLRVILSGGMM